jgi:predicted phosphodiesterase
MTTKKAALKKTTKKAALKKAAPRKAALKVPGKKAPAKKTPAKKISAKNVETLRYATPFFTPTPPDQRPMTEFGQRAQQFAKQNLGAIPKPRTSPPVMTLADVIGQPGSDQLTAAGAVEIHAVGDTGRHGGSTQEEAVATAMTQDFVVGQNATNPAFYLHLGDVIYGPNKDQAYRDAFYRPYMEYPGKIIAIPGNHDGETFPTTDPTSLEAFQANFCLPTAQVPPIAQQVGILRQMVPQPGVYWWLQHDLFDVIGLYSNHGEGQGDLTDGQGDNQQTTFLATTLQSIATARQKSGTTKALLICTHHPSFSAAGHTGSAQMLAQIDAACTTAGIVPHVMLSGHAHNYQRYTRANTISHTPPTTAFIVAGTGGYGLDPIAAAATPPPAAAHAKPPAHGSANAPVFNKSLGNYGYLRINITLKQISIQFLEVTPPSGPATLFDSIILPV